MHGLGAQTGAGAGQAGFMVGQAGFMVGQGGTGTGSVTTLTSGRADGHGLMHGEGQTLRITIFFIGGQGGGVTHGLHADIIVPILI
ncbi:hypothetical protein [Halodesulfovibrio spirochaetisodalis]|uniref:Uncharacterized protein n=1 Tax=Halodesulfovibrio spirochaetisodalis TaxID=1560234 RepID=A0A1B7XBD1_9BACT|nr:hypothetical protein [Halodesulfovibrio spirochaetisodalis]OBQ46637.1 hypothetical protein SP90_11610 [Halodesulfovibrio spirochaetisodalis]